MNGYRRAIGLTLGTHSAKLVEVVRRGPFASIVRSGRVRLSGNPDEAMEVLRRFMDKGGWNRGPFLVAVPTDALFLRRIETPGGRAELRGALETEMSAFREMMPGGVIQDFTVTGRRDGKLSALLAVTRPESLDRFLSPALELGAEVVDAIPAPIAFYTAAVHLLRLKREQFLGIMVGWDGTDVIAGTARDFLFSRRIPIGRALLPREAGGVAVPSKAGQESAPNPAFERWMDDIHTCMAGAFEAVPGNAAPTRLLLCGIQPVGPCAVSIENRLGMPMVFPDALHPETTGEESGRMLAAAGLALAGVGRARIRLSLLPPQMREGILLRRQGGAWAGAITAAALAVALLAGDAYLDRRVLREEIAARKQEIRRIEETRQEVLRLRESNFEFEQSLLQARKSAASGRAVSALLELLTHSKHPDDWITLVADAAAYYAPDPVQTPQPFPHRTGSFHFVIEGYTPSKDLSSVRAMIDFIRRSPSVATADLLGDDRIRPDRIRADRILGIPLRRFAVEVTLWPR